MTSLDDFDYILWRLKRDPDSATAQALRMIFVHGRLPVEAVKVTGVPMVRLMPAYEEAKKIEGAMRLTEADGFSAEELALANRALAASRAKETRYVPSNVELTALALLQARPGGTALKAMDGSVDELPGAAFKVLATLHKMGAVDAANEGLMVVRWAITPAGVQMVNEGMQKR